MNAVSVEEFLRKCKELTPQQQSEISNVQEKILYYLGILGVYTEYERHYGPDYVKITLNPISKEYLKQRIRKYIGGYETKDYLNRKIGSMDWMDQYDDDDIEGIILASMHFLINYSYEKIKTYRQKQTEIMYKCIQASKQNDESVFTEEIYKYFESKYADELLKDVHNENMTLINKWIDKIESDVTLNNENIRENLSHLRTSALKVQEARPLSFTPYFLYAYAILSDPDMDIRSGIDSYIKGVSILKGLRSNYRSAMRRFCQHIFNSEEYSYLNEVDKIIKNEYDKNDDLIEMREMLAHELKNEK